MNFKKIVSIIAGLIILSVVGIFVFISQYDFSSHVVKAAELIHEKTGRKLIINGKTKLKIGFTPRLVIHDLTFENASWSDAPQMVKANLFEIELELIELLKRNIIIKRFGIKNSEILVEKNHDGVSNLMFEQKQSKELVIKENKDSSPPDFYFNNLVIENCIIRFRNAKTNESNVMNIKRLNAFAADVRSPLNLNILASYDHLNISVSGSIGRIKELFKKNHPYLFDIDTKINDSDIKLKGSIVNALGSAIPRIKFDAHSNQFISASFAPPKSKTKTESLKPHKKKLFPSEKISNNFLKNLDLEANINISQLILDTLTLHTIKSKLTIQNNKLILKPFTASAFNGKLSGRFTMKAIKKNLGIKTILNIQALNTHLLTQHYNLDKGLKGDLDADFSLNTTGSSVSQLMAALNGVSWLTMKNGQIESGFVQSLGGDIFTNALRFLNPFDEKVESNQLNCAAARVEFKNGIGNIKLLLADMPFWTASGKGQINFQNETIDIAVKPSPKKGIGTKATGNINLSLSQVAKAFKLVGPLVSPELQIDNTEATKSLLKTTAGVVLFGPVGIIAALVGTNKANQSPCPCALIVAREGHSKNCSVSENANNAIKESGSDQESNPIKKIFSIFD